MILEQWALEYGVSAAALADLRFRMGQVERASAPTAAERDEGHSESRQQSLILDVSMHHGVWLTRNNVGALVDDRGVPIRYGLANETKARNTVVKSGDLIGIRPLLITPQHVGMMIGQFVSVECKKENWQFNGRDKHQIAQKNWADFVNAKGGLAMFANSPDNFIKQLNHSRFPLPTPR